MNLDYVTTQEQEGKQSNINWGEGSSPHWPVMSHSWLGSTVASGLYRV